MFFYENHLGGFYFSDEPLDYDELYCEECGDSDTYIGSARTRREARTLFHVRYDDEGYAAGREDIRRLLDDAFGPGQHFLVKAYKYLGIYRDDDEYYITEMEADDPAQYGCFASLKEAETCAEALESDVSETAGIMLESLPDALAKLRAGLGKRRVQDILDMAMKELGQRIFIMLYSDDDQSRKE